MLAYEGAVQRLLEQVPRPRVVRLSLQRCWGRVLATGAYADLDLPPFDKSFMDGYALRSADVSKAPARLEIVGTIAAGRTAHPRVGPGQAVRIMTGAPVPQGADAVQMVEKTRQVDSSLVEILEPVSLGQNIAPQGEEVVDGSIILEPGRVVGPAEIGVLATFGKKEFEVYDAPTVAVISTGDELVSLDQKPGFGQIRNSNAYLLWAQCTGLGLEAEILPVVPDDPEKMREALLLGLEKDLVLFSGGVSMGEYDYVHKVLAQEGLEILFHKVSLKPGKPILVGKKDGHLVFGLPGNPVSTLVTFELFVRPAVRKWMGFEHFGLQHVSGELLQEVKQKPGRMFFKPAHTFWQADRFKVQPIETRGSADLVAFSRADSLLIMGAEVSRLASGAEVEVLLLDKHFRRGG